MTTRQSALSFLSEELKELQQRWLFFVLFGAGLLVAGVLAISSPLVAGEIAITVVGIFLLIGGFIEIAAAFVTRTWEAFFINLLVGVLYVIVGVLMLGKTTEALAALTLLVAVALLVSGVFRMVASITSMFSGWGWIVFGGLGDFLLGVVIWSGWPGSSAFVIGIFVGVGLIFRGATWVSLGISLRNVQVPSFKEPTDESQPSESTTAQHSQVAAPEQ